MSPDPQKSPTSKMQLTTDHNRLIVIVGPTAVGKTSLSLQLAFFFGGEIVSADSRLFYRGMDIGTAKPTKEELVRVRHHLINVANPDQVWSLVKFQEAAYQAIDDILKRGKIPFLVGGTGQYISAIIEGWEIPKAKPSPRLRLAIKAMTQELGPKTLHKRLVLLDPEAASRIDPQNVRRMIRAFEVIFMTGRRFSDQRNKFGSPYQTLIIGVNRPRPDLYNRIDQRIEIMLENGFVEEVKRLLDQGYSPDLPPLSAIGYRQIIQYLRGDISLDEAVVIMKRSTRQYVRRQSNWFKQDDPRIHWFVAESTILEGMIPLIQKFLFNPEE